MYGQLRKNKDDEKAFPKSINVKTHDTDSGDEKAHPPVNNSELVREEKACPEHLASLAIPPSPSSKR